MTPDFQGEVSAETEARPEGFPKLPHLCLVADLVIPQEEILAHALFDLFLHIAEGVHGGTVCWVCRRGHVRSAKEVKVIEKLTHNMPPAILPVDLIYR